MRQALMVAANALGRREALAAARSGRYEDAYRRFGFHPAFEFGEHVLQLRAPGVADARPAARGRPRAVVRSRGARDALAPRLVSIFGTYAHPPDGGVAIDLDYVVFRARTPVA